MTECLCFVTARSGSDGERLLGVVNAVAGNGATVCTSVDSLRRHLSDPAHATGVAVLMAADQDEMQQLLELRGMFIDRKILLVLYDLNQETMLQGHAFLPRFISSRSDTFGDLAAVLARILVPARGSSGL